MTASPLRQAGGGGSAAPEVGVASAQPLLPALPVRAFVTTPDEADRFVVWLYEDGTIYFKGTRERIGEFLAACADVGLDVRVGHVALCG